MVIDIRPFWATRCKSQFGDQCTTRCGNLFATSFLVLCCTSPVALNSLSRIPRPLPTVLRIRQLSTTRFDCLLAPHTVHHPLPPYSCMFSSSRPDRSSSSANFTAPTPFQFLQCLDPIGEVVCQNVFINFSRASCYVLNPIF